VGKAVQAAKMLHGALTRVKTQAVQTGGALKGASKQSAALGVALSNLNAGLDIIGNSFNRLSDRLLEFASDSVDAFATFETSLARVDIALGRTGENRFDEQLTARYDKVKDKVIEIGRDTEHTVGAAADAFKILTQAGVGNAEAIMANVMAFSTASAGALDLDASSRTAAGAMAVMGLELDQVNKFLDQAQFMSTQTKLAHEDLEQVFRSMGAAAQIFPKTTQEQWLAMSGILKQMGASPADIGQSFNTLSRTAGKLALILEGKNLRGAKFAKEALKAFGIVKTDLQDLDGEFKNLPGVIEGIMGKVQIAVEGGMSEAVAQGFLTKLLGSVSASTALLRLTKGRAQSGANLAELIEQTAAREGDALAAQQRVLETFSGQMQILLGSWDLLKVTIGGFIVKAIRPLVKHLTNIVNEIREWTDQYPNLARAISIGIVAVGLFAGAVALVFTALSAVSVVLLVLQPMLLNTGGNMTLAALATNVWSSSLEFLNKRLIPLSTSLAGFAALAGIIWIAYKENLGGFKDWIDGWARDLKEVFNVVFIFLRGEGVEATIWDAMSPRAQEVTIQLVLLKERLVDLIEGFRAGFVPVFRVAVGLFVKAGQLIAGITNILGLSVTRTHEHTMASDEAKWSFKKIGVVLGAVAGIWLGYRAAVALTTLVTWAVRAATIALKSIFIIWKGILWASTAATTAYAIAVEVVETVVWLWNTAQWALNAALVANPIGAIILAVVAYAAAITALIVYYDEVNVALGEWTAGMLDTADILLFIIGPTGLVILIFKKLFEVIVWLSTYWDEAWAAMVGTYQNSVNSILEGTNYMVDQVTDRWYFLFAGPLAPIMWAFGDEVEAFFVYLLELGGEYWPLIFLGPLAPLYLLRDEIRSALNSTVDFIVGLPSAMYDAGVAMIDALRQGWDDTWGKAESWVEDKLGGITDFLPSSPARKGPLRDRPPEKSGEAFVNMLTSGMQSSLPGLTGIVNHIVELVSFDLNRDLALQSAAFSDLIFGGDSFGREFDSQEKARAEIAERTAISTITPDEAVRPLTPGAGAIIPAGEGTAQVINVEARIETGDFRLALDSIDPAELRRFMGNFTELFGEMIEGELRKRSL
jgi:TP901 family phage tail tape measure protein